jgi:hypothetical protein
MLAIGTKVRLETDNRIGTIIGYAVYQHVMKVDMLPGYIVDLGVNGGFWSPDKRTFVSSLVVSADGIAEVF